MLPVVLRLLLPELLLVHLVVLPVLVLVLQLLVQLPLERRLTRHAWLILQAAGAARLLMLPPRVLRSLSVLSLRRPLVPTQVFSAEPWQELLHALAQAILSLRP